jgi:hypothetical protein
MTLSNIEPEQAWRMVLDQLQMEMSKASFDTWVRDTEFVAFEDGILTVGTANTYASEWLTSRLTSTANRMLTGMLNQPVAVRFVVLDFSEENDLVEDGSTPGAKLESDNSPKVITLQAEYQSVYDEIVQPEHVIVFPGYFLRYIPILGQELSWLYIGFRQAAYEAGASKKPGKKVGAPAKKVAHYAGMSPRTFWRWAAKPTTWKLLGRLVKPVEESPQWHRGSDGRPHQATRTYQVAMTMPLTPFDELSLRAWLYPKLADGKNPLAILRLALETPLDELLPWPERMPSITEIDNEPHSVRDVLQAVCNPIAESEQAQFNELADKLAQHLMPPKDLVFITHYFVSQWLPRLGSGPGWLVILMRDHCYLNQRTGEIRDEVRLDQGYAEAARWLGLKRVKTIWEWLRSKDVTTFIRETDREIGSWEEAPRCFKVCMGEPMNEEDQDRANLILANRQDGAAGIHRTSGSNDSIGASDSHSSEVNDHSIGASVTLSETNSDADIGASDIHNGVTDTLSGAIDTHSGASDSHNGVSGTDKHGASVTPIGAPDTHNGASVTIDWRDWHSLISLTPGFKHLINTQTTSAAKDNIDSEGISSEMEKEVVAGEWKLSDLLTLNRVSTRNQELLSGKGLTAQAFISWLLYAASRNGNGINDPVGHAISRLLQDPTQGAGGAFDRLAGLPANELTSLLQWELDRQSPWNTDWRTVMGDAPRPRLRALADQLGVPVPNSNDW